MAPSRQGALKKLFHSQCAMENNNWSGGLALPQVIAGGSNTMFMVSYSETQRIPSVMFPLLVSLHLWLPALLCFHLHAVTQSTRLCASVRVCDCVLSFLHHPVLLPNSLFVPWSLCVFPSVVFLFSNHPYFFFFFFSSSSGLFSVWTDVSSTGTCLFPSEVFYFISGKFY